MKRWLSEFQYVVIYLLCGLLLIEWSIQLIAPLNVLRLVDDLNGLMILSDPNLQSSHELFRLLALLVDFNVSWTTLVRFVSPYLSVNYLIIGLIWGIGLVYKSHFIVNAHIRLRRLLTFYVVLLLMISVTIGVAFVSTSPQQIVVLVNRAGMMGVFGGIILCVLTLMAMVNVLKGVVRQK